jgi:hypothetical protein
VHPLEGGGCSQDSEGLVLLVAGSRARGVLLSPWFPHALLNLLSFSAE